MDFSITIPNFIVELLENILDIFEEKKENVDVIELTKINKKYINRNKILTLKDNVF